MAAVLKGLLRYLLLKLISFPDTQYYTLVFSQR